MNEYYPDRAVIVFSDFDGTITRKDTLVFLLEKFGESNWQEIEGLVKANQLSEREALQAEFDTVRVGFEDAILAVLNKIEIDPYFSDFVDWLKFRDIPLIILSGGFDQISRAILARENLVSLELRANSVEVKDGRWRVIPSSRPRIKNLCNHCKSSSIEEAKSENFFTVYIGDGLTDRCPAKRTDLIFAKGDLEEYCLQEGLEYVPFESFADVQGYLAGIIQEGVKTDKTQ